MLVLITGARGSIGSHVVRAASSRGYRTIGLGHGSWTDDHKLPTINHWINGDINAENLSSLSRAAGMPDIVIHLAGGSVVGASISDPGEDFCRTVLSAQHLFEWLRLNAPSTRVVFGSSAAVYGDGHTGPIPETALYAPKSPYGTHKAMVELLISSYAREFKLQFVILRMFSVYGPGLRKQLIWELASRILAGQSKLELGGTGDELRDFLFVSDAADMLLNAATFASVDAPIFNGASGAATTISQIASRVAIHLGGPEINFSGQSRPGDPFSLVADTSRAAAAGLIPSVSLDIGLATTLNWISLLNSKAVI